jgi:uncharacterized membrane protein
MMKRIIRYLTVLLAVCAALAGCKKFTEPEPYEFAHMEPTMTLADFKALYTGALDLKEALKETEG